MSDYQIFDSFQDAVIVIDLDHNVHYGNEAAGLLFDLSARKLNSGKSFSQLISLVPDALLDHKGLAELTSATQVREVEFSSGTGKTGWGQIFLQPQPAFFDQSNSQDPAGKRFIVCIRDVSLEKTLHDKYRMELDQKESMISDLRDARAKLEDYSRNLELKVELRTVELSEANVLLKTILDSLGQGILVFDREGRCLPIYSQICLKMFGIAPAGSSVESVLQLSTSDANTFRDWREAVFNEMLDFEDLVPLAPERFQNKDGLEIFLDYNQLKKTTGAVNGVVVVATDRTREMQALRAAEVERALVRRIVQVARNREAFKLFVSDARSMLKVLRKTEVFDFEDISRQLHTVKGGAATFALDSVASVCHELEDAIKQACDPEQKLAFLDQLRVRAKVIGERLDKEIRDISELLGPVISVGTPDSLVEMSLESCLAWVERLLSARGPEEIRRVASEILMQCSEKQLGEFVQPYSESLSELASRLGKKLNPLEVIGGDTRAPIRLVSSLLSTLVHAFRNAVDHGIEAPEEREASGKSREGHISVLFARDEGSHTSDLRIEIRDDGRGINVEKVRDKLIGVGRTEAAGMSDEEVCQMVLTGAISTAETVTEISGRGIGLAAVTEEVTRLGGKIRIASQPRLGCIIYIQVPLVLNVESLKFDAA